MRHCLWIIFFFFNDTATTEIYTLSLHDALPIFARVHHVEDAVLRADDGCQLGEDHLRDREDRKSTRLNSSHGYISYAVFCLKKKKITRRYSDFRWRPLYPSITAKRSASPVTPQL